MENREDIRWKQRFSNYNKALVKLSEAVHMVEKDFYRDGKFDKKKFEQADDIIVEGLIQRFEYTHELAWNVMKDFLESRGDTGIYGSRDATREAFQKELILDGDTWMDMIKSRNKSSHTYNEETAMEIFLKTIEAYHPCFIALQSKMQELKTKEESL
ncbi:MAG: nucleotidyltransferase substrate binding protein [Saprospiraceae bacterium]